MLFALSAQTVTLHVNVLQNEIVLVADNIHSSSFINPQDQHFYNSVLKRKHTYGEAIILSTSVFTKFDEEKTITLPRYGDHGEDYSNYEYNLSSTYLCTSCNGLNLTFESGWCTGTGVTQTFRVPNYNKMAFNTIRAAIWESCDPIPTSFLKNAKENKFNYIFLSVQNFGNPRTNIWKTKDEVFNAFKDAFVLANTYNIRIIPLIAMGSHWVDWCKQPTNTAIGNSKGWTHMGVPYDNSAKLWVNGSQACPAMADETGLDGGIDDIFVEFLTLIKNAHKAANVNYPLEFIHLGHDEPWTNPNPIEDISLCYGITQTSDQTFINKLLVAKPPYTINEAFYSLLYSELTRRIEQVQKNINSFIKGGIMSVRTISMSESIARVWDELLFTRAALLSQKLATPFADSVKPFLTRSLAISNEQTSFWDTETEAQAQIYACNFELDELAQDVSACHSQTSTDSLDYGPLQHLISR
jgi:hypothetical protein